MNKIFKDIVRFYVYKPITGLLNKAKLLAARYPLMEKHDCDQKQGVKELCVEDNDFAGDTAAVNEGGVTAV